MRLNLELERDILLHVQDLADTWVNGDTPIKDKRAFVEREWKKYERGLDFSQREEYKRRFVTQFDNSIQRKKI